MTSRWIEKKRNENREKNAKDIWLDEFSFYIAIAGHRNSSSPFTHGERKEKLRAFMSIFQVNVRAYLCTKLWGTRVFFFVCSEIDWNLLTISNLIAQQMNEAASSVSSLRTQKKKKCCRVVIFIIRIWLFLFINVAIVAGWMQMNRVEPRKVSAPQTSARITTIEWYEQTNLYSLHVSGNRECEAKPNTQMLNQSKLCMNAAHKILILILLNFEKNRSSASILELVSFLRFVWPPFGPEKYEENT